MSLPIIILVALIMVVLYVVGIYNGLVANKTQIGASVQEIGNQLKRQSELIPNLETSAKAYLKHEKEILKMLSDARKMSDPSAKVAEILPKLQVIMESNPQMKGADVITDLMAELRDTSDKVMYSRRTMIDLTADYNIKISTFPSNLVANAFGFKAEKGLEMPGNSDFLKVTTENIKIPKISI